VALIIEKEKRIPITKMDLFKKLLAIVTF